MSFVGDCHINLEDVGATLVSPTVAEAGFGRSKDRPYIASFFYQK